MMTRHATASRIVATTVLAAIFGSLFATPFDVKAQSPSRYQLFGVNLSGTLPWMDYEQAGRDVDGKTITDGKLSTPEGRLTLTIPAGTFIRNAAGLPQEFISATQVAEPPQAPAQQKVLFAYLLGTAGATFNPTVGMSLLFYGISLPQGVGENNLFIASWNGTEWVKLSSSVDTAAKTVSTTISSFTTYALMANLQPPATTTAPPPTTTTSQPTTTPTTTPASTASPSPTASPEPKSNSMIIILAAGALALVMVLVLLSRKR